MSIPIDDEVYGEGDSRDPGDVASGNPAKPQSEFNNVDDRQSDDEAPNRDSND
jgi:hypothetical protein